MFTILNKNADIRLTLTSCITYTTCICVYQSLINIIHFYYLINMCMGLKVHKFQDISCQIWVLVHAQELIVKSCVNILY